jgi:hypothetical protein
MRVGRQHNAALASTLHRGICFLGAGKWITGVDDWRRIAALLEAVRQVSKQLRRGYNVALATVGADEASFVMVEVGQIELYAPFPRRGDFDDPAARRGHLQRGFECDASEVSNTRSAPLPAVKRRTSSGAPSLLRMYALSTLAAGAACGGSLRSTPRTIAPCAAATSATAPPTPPPAPMIATVSPDCSSPYSIADSTEPRDHEIHAD